MRGDRVGFAGWPGGVRAPAPEPLEKRDAQVTGQFEFVRRALTPRTVFMEMGSADCELALRVAGYVERVWCVDAASRPTRPPCNLRCTSIGGVPVKTIDVAFSERVQSADELRCLLRPGGV